MTCHDWAPACLSGRREPEHDPLAEEFVGPWCDVGDDGGPVPGRCSVAPLRPEEEAHLRAAYGSRAPYWNKDWDTLGLLSTIDAARRERDQARASLAAMHRRAQEAESQAERLSHEVTDARARADQLGVKLLQALRGEP